eukprot:403363832
MISKHLFTKTTACLLVAKRCPTQFQVYASQRQFGFLDSLFKGKKQEKKPTDPTSEGYSAKTQEQIDKQQEIEALLQKELKEEAIKKQQQEFEVQSRVEERDRAILNLEIIDAQKKQQSQSQQQISESAEGELESFSAIKKTKKLLNKVQSYQDRLLDVRRNPDGSLTHNIFKSDSSIPREFKDEKVFEKWVKRHLKERQDHLKENITPYQLYLTQAAGTERPYSGEYWWTKDPGVYSCVCCTQKLFMSDHKFDVPTGHASFWNHIVDAVDFTEDKLKTPKVNNAHVDTLYKNKTPIKRCVCSNCEAHLGLVYNDGPAPYGKRFSINSGSVSFTPKPWGKAPTMTHDERMEFRRQQVIMKKNQQDVQDLKDQAKMLGLKSWIDKARRKSVLVNAKVDKNAETAEQKGSHQKKQPVFNLKGAATVNLGNKLPSQEQMQQ